MRHIALIAIATALASCTTSMPDTTFTLGTDMGWLTEMEARGQKFYDKNGNERECMSLMADYGIKAQRMRVWVDPSAHGNWCNQDDVLAKCKRAKSLGQEVMIDFHYSDWWADPGKQPIPAEWSEKPYEEVREKLADHTRHVLKTLKDNDIEPRWVQVGNETSNGMLWSVRLNDQGWEWRDSLGNVQITESMGHLERNPKQYAGFFEAGYQAAKSVFPNTTVIVHLDNGFSKELYDSNLDTLVMNGAHFDMIGMSLYPYWSMQGGKVPDATTAINMCVENIKHVSEKYGVDVMIVETGYEVDETRPEVMEQGRDQLSMLIDKCKNNTDGHCRGIFYWEPECKPSQYKLGAFTEDGRPTVIMDAFLTK